MSLVSVIIPVFNRKDRLCIAVDSVLKQTYKNLEILIIDDASTDDTIDNVKQKYSSLSKLPHNKLPKHRIQSAKFEVNELFQLGLCFVIWVLCFWGF